MSEPTPSPQTPRKTPRHDLRRNNVRRKKPRRQVSFKATVRNDHVHLQASAPTRWFQVLRWIIFVLVIALTIHFMPELWQAIQTALQAMPK